MVSKVMCPDCGIVELALPELRWRGDAVYVGFPVQWTLHIATEHPDSFEKLVERCVATNRRIDALPRDVDGTLLAQGVEVGSRYRELAASGRAT